MATSNLNFSAQIDDWVKETEQRMTAVFRESAERVKNMAALGVPVDKGFARASIRGSTDSMPQIDRSATNKAGRVYDAGAAISEVSLVIAGAQIGQTIFVGWTAAYILPLEYGHSKQAPNGFVRLAAAQWQTVVNQVTAEAKARVAASSAQRSRRP